MRSQAQGAGRRAAKRRRDTELREGQERAALSGPSAQQRSDFAAAHAEGLHEIPREFCPECEAEGRER